MATLPGSSLLPETFTTTHDTDGLPGFGAFDAGFKGGQIVGLPVGGTVERMSGSVNRGRGSGGAYSGSVYGGGFYLRTDTGQRLYLTHFSQLFVRPRQRIEAGEPVGRVAPWGSFPHIHVGVQGAPDRGGKVVLGRAPSQGGVPGQQAAPGSAAAFNEAATEGGKPRGDSDVLGVPNPLGAIRSLGDALAFIFSLRFLEIVGGGILVLAGLVLLARRLGASVPVPKPL